MRRLRRLPPLVALTLTVPTVGLLAAPALATSEPPDSDTTDSDSTDSDTTADSATTDMANGIELDPARRDWLEFTDDADPDTFAGGADLHELVDGNRVIMIGDSVLASTAARFGGEMCDTVVEQGWDVEIDAETGRFVDFGEDVLDDRLGAGFDAAVIVLGNNYNGDRDAYEKSLRDILARLEPRPVVLVTVSLFRPDRSQVNDAIYDIARDFDTVRVLDWAGETAADDALTSGDGVHLTDLGRARLAAMVADELGDAPGRGEGECLDTSFTDDSAGSTEPAASGSAPHSTAHSNPAPQPQPTQPQWNPPAPTGGGGGGGGDNPVAPTDPPQTMPPATDAPAPPPEPEPSPTAPATAAPTPPAQPPTQDTTG